jgi:hypothetical protein
LKKPDRPGENKTRTHRELRYVSANKFTDFLAASEYVERRHLRSQLQQQKKKHNGGRGSTYGANAALLCNFCLIIHVNLVKLDVRKLARV